MVCIWPLALKIVTAFIVIVFSIVAVVFLSAWLGLGKNNDSTVPREAVEDRLQSQVSADGSLTPAARCLCDELPNVSERGSSLAK